MGAFDLPRPHVDVERLLSERQWVQRLARSLVADPNQADDVAQESWLTALRHPPRHDTNLKSWLSRLVRNTAAAMRRSEARRSDRERIATKATATSGSSEALERAELVRELVDAVLSLDLARREAIVLVYFEGLAPNAAADRLGIPHSTLRSHVSRGLAEVREKLERKRGREGWLSAVTAIACRPETHAVGITLMKTKLVAACVVIAAALLIHRLWFADSSTPLAPSQIVASEPLGDVHEQKSELVAEPTLGEHLPDTTQRAPISDVRPVPTALPPKENDAGPVTLWGRISVDGVPATPSGLRITLENRDDKTEARNPARKAVPIVDADTNSFRVTHPLTGSFLLTAASNGTSTFTALVQRAAGEAATQLDLDLRMGFAVVVRAIDDASDAPLVDVPVEVEYSMLVDTRAELNARFFHPVVQKGRTDESGTATIRGVETGRQITVRVMGAETREPRGVVELMLEADAPSPHVVTMRIRESKSSDVVLWGTTEFDPFHAREECQVMLAPKGQHAPVSTMPMRERAWRISTNFRGPARLWIQAGKERVTAAVECVVGERDQGPIHLPLVSTQSLVVRWKNAPVGWSMRWGQARGGASVSTIATRDGETMLSVEPEEALTCKLDTQAGDFLWISWKQARSLAASAPVDFGSVPPRPVRLQLPHPERLTVDAARIEGDVILEMVDLPGDLRWRRMRLVLVQGTASLPFRMDNQETFYRVNATCVNACIAGLIDPAAAGGSGALGLGQDCEWQALDQSRLSIQNTLIVTGIGKRSLEAVPDGLRRFLGRTILCAGSDPGSTPPTAVLVPGNKAEFAFEP